MSDVSQPSVPPPSAPPPSTPAPAPQHAEVPVDQSPVSSPTPLGEQAPPKPPGQQDNKSSHVSRREALQNAFARSKQAQDEAVKDAPKRKVGIGDNHPPEPIEAEAKKPPTTAQVAERYRESGKFARDPAKADQTPPGEQPQPGQQSGQPARPKPLDERAPFREPPGRFSDQAKTEWAAAPESVRGAVHQMAREFQGAYERYRGSHEVMQELQPYHDLATKQGTTLRKAFDNYYAMEGKLRSDLVGGLDVLVQNVARGQNLRKADGSLINLQDVALHIISMTPEQQQLSAQRNQQSSAEMKIGQLHQQVDQLSQGISQLLYREKFTQTRSQVDQFAQKHPRFDELSDLIKSELDLGFTLEQAYARADRLRPAPPQAAQTRNTPAQTRKTSISGAPDGNGRPSVTTRPSDGRQRTNGEAKHPTRREAIAKAMRRVGNGV